MEEKIKIEVEIDGARYEVVHQFNESRVIVSYQGAFVFADQAADGVWELSGIPAREDEKAVLKSFTDPMNDVTVVTVTKPQE